MTTASEPRRRLLGLLQAALTGASGRAAVGHFLSQKSSPQWTTVRVVAIGKAAVAMSLGAFDALGEHIADALIITKHGHGIMRLPFPGRILEAGHPTPDAASLEAGRALLAFIESAPQGVPFVFLISGGASALVEALREEITLDDLARANQWLLASGLEIGAMNRIRKRLSRIKQGRLALRLQGHAVLNVLISDVAGDDPAVIGSGLLVADPHADEPLPPLPAWLAALCAETSAVHHELTHVETHIVANNQTALDAVRRQAERDGLVIRTVGHMEGDARATGARMAEQLKNGPPGLYLWGGETTVTLPDAPGRGGRCQTLALSAALTLAGETHCFLLAAGTDGTDGPGEDAGALVDGDTIARGAAEGLDARDALLRADAGAFLEASGDLIATGPTGTNVMDVVFALKVHRDKMPP